MHSVSRWSREIKLIPESVKAGKTARLPLSQPISNTLFILGTRSEQGLHFAIQGYQENPKSDRSAKV